VTRSPAKLIEVPVDPATLTDRQRQALEYVRRADRQVHPAEVGLHVGTSVAWATNNGLDVLRALKAKGLVTERAGKRFELSEAGRRAVGTSVQGGEIPF
jgi:uncharacterized protein YjhX (UPF0386 family)